MSIQAFAYGKVLARPVLTLLERELLAVSILTALVDLEGPLLGHMRACVRLGATQGDVGAAVPHALGEADRDAGTALVDRLGTRGTAPGDCARATAWRPDEVVAPTWAPRSK